MTADQTFFDARQEMVKAQLIPRDIEDVAVLRAMANVPRHLFVPERYRRHAYKDRPLGIGKRQTISQPYIVALMTQLLQLQGTERILEIGTGSGYQAAVLAEIVPEIYSIERHQDLAERAAATLHDLGLNQVQVRHGDGSLGWPEHGPYDGILVTAAAPDVPQPLLDQLADGGRLIVPVGDVRGQVLQSWRRHGDETHFEVLVPVSFVPLRGELGWSAATWLRPDDKQ